MNAPIAVVIPYFQAQPGILARALHSVSAQGYGRNELDVVVVDDDSPIPAEGEVAQFEDRLAIRLLKRSNGGPGAARNTGLNHVDPSTRFVAFLDSDDVWEYGHLRAATQALEQSGASFFFSNFLQLRATTPAFERAGRLSKSDHQVVGEDTYVFSGDMGAQILTGNVIGTPTVVFDFARHGGLRFRTEYRRMGEDYLMWLDFWRDQARFVFRWTPSVICKEGVNVFAGVSWGTVALLERTRDELRFTRTVLDTYALPEAARKRLEERITERRRFFAKATASALRRSPLATVRYFLESATGPRPHGKI